MVFFYHHDWRLHDRRFTNTTDAFNRTADALSARPPLSAKSDAIHAEKGRSANSYVLQLKLPLKFE